MIDFPVLPSGEKPVWDGRCFQLDGCSTKVLVYSSNVAGWDDDLTLLHEVEAGDGRHPIDLASRRCAIDALRRHGFPENGAVLEIGCSSGFLLRDLQEAFPLAEVAGADITTTALQRLAELLPGVPLAQMDLLQSPMKDGQFDAVVALNVLEHIESDEAALRKMSGLLKPGGILVLEVPQGPVLYDYFDAYLRHFRRYGKNELVDKVVAAGLRVERFGFLGFLPYPAFLIVKKLNRLRYGIRGEKSPNVEKLVRAQIKGTATSMPLRLAFSIEKALARWIPFPVGIRLTVVARRS